MEISPLIESAFQLATKASVQGSIFVLCLVCIRFLAKERISPAWGYALWLLVLVRLTIWDLPDTRWSLFNLAKFDISEMVILQEAEADSVETTLTPSDLANVPQPSFMGNESAREQVERSTSSPLPITNREPIGELPTNQSQPGQQQASELPRISSLFAIGWLTVALLFLLRFLSTNLSFSFRLNRCPKIESPKLRQLLAETKTAIGVKRSIELVESSDVDTPAVFGLTRVRLLIPKGQQDHYTQAEWRDLFLHELAHIKRHDHTTNLWLSLIQILHWYNPLVHWMAARMRIERELACDAHVLSVANNTSTKHYGETILKAVNYLPTNPVAKGQLGVLENKKHLKERIRMIAQNTPRPRIQLIAATAWVGLAALLLTEGQPTSSTSSTSSIEPIALDAHYDHPNASFDSLGFLATNDQAWTWDHVPKGNLEYLGVPFHVNGTIRLKSKESTRDNRHHRSLVKGIPVGKSFEKIYLLHATHYTSPEGDTTAQIKLNYSDQSSSTIDLRYGVHTRDWWRHKYESPVNLSDPFSRVAWTGNDEKLATYGKSLRLCLTALDVPQPKKKIKSIDLVSANSFSAQIVFAISGGPANLPAEWLAKPKRMEPEIEFNQSIAFRAIDKDTGKPINKLHLRVEGADPHAHFFLGRFFSDANGLATIQIPKAPLIYLTIWANADGYPPMIVQWDTRHHGPFPASYDYRISQGTTIGGRVEDTDGNPVEGVEVRISGPRIDIDSGEKQHLALTKELTVTDSSGYWEYQGIPEGTTTYQLSFNHPNYLQSYVSVYDLAEEKTARLPARLGRTELTHDTLSEKQTLIRLQRGTQLTGTVTDKSGTPVHNVRVSLGQGTNRRTTLSDSAGHFQFDNTIPSLNVLTVGHPSYETRNFGHSLSNRAPRTIAMTAGQSFSCQILGENGEAIPNVHVRFRNKSHTFQSFTDMEGVFSCNNAPEGPFELILSHPAYINRIISAQSGGFRTPRFTMEPAVVLSGTVINQKTKAPIAHARILTGIRLQGEQAIVWSDIPQGIVLNGQYVFTFRGDSNYEKFLRIEADGYEDSISKAFTQGGRFTENFELETRHLP